MTMRIVPNPGQSHADLAAQYGQIAEAPLPQGSPPANLPGSPPFQMPPLETRSGPGPSYASGPVGPATPPSGLPGPIYPGTWKGHSWHVGPGVKYDGRVDQFMGGQTPQMYGGFVQDYTQDSEFQKFLKFGIVDNGLMLIFAALGVGLDEKIAQVLKVPRGWGPLVGAAVGNTISDFAAALTDKESGFKAAVGVTAGCLIPIIPVALSSYVLKKSPDDKMSKYLIMGSSAAMVLWAFTSKK